MRPNRTGMMGVRWATLGAVLACAIVVVVAVSACGGGDSGDNSQAAAYYASVAAASAKLDQRVAAYADHIQTADDPQIAASFSKFNDDLQDFAHDADVLKPPASVSDPHKRLVQATVDLADAVFQQSLSGIGTHAPTQVEINWAIKQAHAIKAWDDACKELQGKAASKKIDVDLKCSTALHQKESPGI